VVQSGQSAPQVPAKCIDRYPKDAGDSFAAVLSGLPQMGVTASMQQPGQDDPSLTSRAFRQPPYLSIPKVIRDRNAFGGAAAAELNLTRLTIFM
jgi:hypothetical protein